MVMYTKINYLQSVMTGDYTNSGYMAGNLVDVTIGGYLWETPCILNSLNVTIPNESPWEIGVSDPSKGSGQRSGQNIDTSLDIREMPHIIQVTGFNFTPIHEFAPRKQKNLFTNKGVMEEFGKQRYIALKAEDGDATYDKQVNGEIRNDLKFSPTSQVKGNDVNAELNKSEPLTIVAPQSDLSKKYGGLA